MGLMRKQMLMRQKARFEHTLQDRLSFLSGKGIKSPKAEKDTIVRKMMADLKAVNKRLRVIAASEKRTEEMAKIKAERAAAPQKEQEGGKGEKPKKALEEGKGKKIKAERAAAPQKEQEGGKGEKHEKAAGEGKEKKIKAEKKAAPQKEPEGDKSQKTTESPEEGKAKTKKKAEEAGEEPAGQVKAEK